MTDRKRPWPVVGDCDTCGEPFLTTTPGRTRYCTSRCQRAASAAQRARNAEGAPMAASAEILAQRADAAHAPGA